MCVCVCVKVVKRIIGQWLHATATAFSAAWAQAVEASKVNKGKKFKKKNCLYYMCVFFECRAISVDMNTLAGVLHYDASDTRCAWCVARIQ